MVHLPLPLNIYGRRLLWRPFAGHRTVPGSNTTGKNPPTPISFLIQMPRFRVAPVTIETCKAYIFVYGIPFTTKATGIVYIHYPCVR